MAFSLPNLLITWLQIVLLALLTEFGEQSGDGKDIIESNVLLWLILKDGLKANSLRKTRKLTDIDRCPMCNSHPESSLHAIRDCCRAKRIWALLKVDSMDPGFYNHDLFNWIFVNHANKGAYREDHWSNTFTVTNSTLSNTRNDFVFNNKSFPESELIHKIQFRVNELSSANPNLTVLSEAPPTKSTCLIHWNYPPSELSNAMRMARNIGHTSINMTGLWGILTALRIAKDRGIQKIWIETNSTIAVKLLQDNYPPSHPCRAIILAIQALLEDQ
ncbi:Ribonuclease H-like superfamily [Sesbania bispinosa]|nr:Ribonuclease H-like superfamily [Sesbania bispinosa]